jgi:hypothetical protein
VEVKKPQKKVKVQEDDHKLVVGKKFYGSEDRFPPGQAWYHNVSTGGQLGQIRAPGNTARFYPLLNNKN